VTKKRLQLFKDAFPEQHAALAFWDSQAANSWRAAADAAPSLGIALAGVELRDPPYDYERGLQQVAPEFRGALFMSSSAGFVPDAARLAAFALRHRMVSSFDATPLFVDAGGLMSYGADYAAAARRAAELADRIAHSAKPSDLPIEQSTRFTLRINLKTAKALGITFPPTFLAIADEVIE
jgi:putative ABC transport system substrate-binding protein